MIENGGSHAHAVIRQQPPKYAPDMFNNAWLLPPPSVTLLRG